MKPLRHLLIPLTATSLILAACSSGNHAENSTTTEAISSPAVSTTEAPPADEEEITERDPEDFLIDDRFYVLELADAPFPFVCAIGPDSEQSFFCATDFGGTDPTPAFEANEPLEYWDNVTLLQFDPVLGYNPVLNHPMESMPPHSTLTVGESVTLSGHTFTRDATTVTIAKGAHSVTLGKDTFTTNAGSMEKAADLHDTRLGEQCGTVAGEELAEHMVFPLLDHTNCEEGIAAMEEYLTHLAGADSIAEGSDEEQPAREDSIIEPAAWQSSSGWKCEAHYVLPFHHADATTMNPTCTAGNGRHQVVALHPDDVN